MHFKPHECKTRSTFLKLYQYLPVLISIILFNLPLFTLWRCNKANVVLFWTSISCCEDETIFIECDGELFPNWELLNFGDPLKSAF